MTPKVFKIQNDNLSVVFKGYVERIVYGDNTAFKEKHWCDGVYSTRKKAEDASKRLLKKLRK